MRAALFCIFTYLDTRTLLHAAEVCRDWRFVARHPAVWTRVLLENARVCSKVPAPACLLCPAVNPPFPVGRIWSLKVWSLQPLQHCSANLASLKCSHAASYPGLAHLQPTKCRPLHLQILFPSPTVPGNAGSVVHPGPLSDAAELEAPAAGKEGEQGGVCP